MNRLCADVVDQITQFISADTGWLQSIIEDIHQNPELGFMETRTAAIVSRVLDPRDPAVITVGAIQAGIEDNTIPDLALPKLSFRFFDLEVRRGQLKGSQGVPRPAGPQRGRTEMSNVVGLESLAGDNKQQT